jgi:hypothetical protein
MLSILYSVFCITYVLFTVYVTLPPGIGPTAVGNIYIYKITNLQLPKNTLRGKEKKLVRVPDGGLTPG